MSECRGCKDYQTNHDNEWCESGEMGRSGCIEYHPTKDRVKDLYQALLNRERWIKQCMRSVAH